MQWDRFVVEAGNTLDALLHDKIDMDSAWRFFEENAEFMDKEMLDFFLDSISEIDGDPGGYRELVRLMRTGPRREQIREYMESPLKPS